MFLSIGKQGGRNGPPGSDVTRLLTECHVRIRSFSALGTLLAQSAGAPKEELAASAAQVARYFTVGLPKHVQDEDESIMPRLLPLVGQGEVAEALDRMKREHVTIDERLAQLVPLWRIVEQEPGRVAELAPRLAEAAPLEKLLEQHLRLEEDHVFPAIQRFSPADLAAIGAEMRARRAPA